ncbi:DUF4335 domain-containing protein [Dolichospermum circinale CS-534/05]|uniref:DUF4335 domain-containing protein n=1 Tax=Dolichospermum circinale TaxID=109265 RepID=UPI0023314EE7|nr:DUF4335 domain-containing protein [Dolichospermum circinale]MDB9453689.1 DUF4335 domain-containing protein [Dolichospermum circinale CS-541/06]MDB9462310.1 DUF4335 domain-containing protein [Dolichospermum circinale CS-541/04]MDB9491492.1 DUF4335 domain-containing protein [Dolichospermum circinale CS-534/05]MDB9549070.1 DUF4335 domain-containing protein [Dolichospermum circinale CS-1031]
MSSSNSVIRRYTAPTCTLEIWAQNSSLSRWAERNVIRDLSFRLEFDHSGLSADSQILIQGDNRQLEVLCDTVTSYVQKIIQASAADLSDSLSNTDHDNRILEPESQNVLTSVLSTPTLPSLNDQTPAAKVYLEPSHNLTHKLFLGDLANQTSGSVIELSLLQLFDLATVIDECSSNMMVLPTISAETTRPSLPQWVPIAAVLVVAASLTPFTWQYAQKIQQNQQKIAKNNYPVPEKDQVEDPALSFSNALPIPPINLNTPGTPLTPPPINSTTPSPSLSFPNGTIPAAPKTSPQPALTIPPNTFSYPAVPNPPGNSPGITAKSVINSTKPKNLPSTKIPSSVYTPPPSIVSITKESFSNSPNTLSSSDIMELKQDTVGIATQNQDSIPKNNDNLVSRLRTATKTTSETQASNNKTLFDTPQIAEAREYLNKRWQPPTGLDQTLEYSLTLGVDGTIERIEPLNPSARQYIDSSGIPEIGKPFVSSNKSGQSLKIRVVLSPDSRVQTFPETP